MSTQEFDTLAQGYQAYRPGYPGPLVEAVIAFALAGRSATWPGVPTAVDVGSGTGISTRQLHEASAGALRWIGVEPGRSMREQALATTPMEMGISFVAGTAEALPFVPDSVVLVTAAQAIQWFDRPRFYAEVARVLRSGGALAVMQNNREWRRSPFLDAYETFLETHGDRYTRHYRNLPVEEELRALPGCDDFKRCVWHWTMHMSPEDFVGLCSSSTKGAAVIERLGAEATRAELLALAARHHPGAQQVPIEYVAELFITRRQRSE